MTTGRINQVASQAKRPQGSFNRYTWLTDYIECEPCIPEKCQVVWFTRAC